MRTVFEGDRSSREDVASIVNRELRLQEADDWKYLIWRTLSSLKAFAIAVI